MVLMKRAAYSSTACADFSETCKHLSSESHLAYRQLSGPVFYVHILEKEDEGIPLNSVNTIFFHSGKWDFETRL